MPNGAKHWSFTINNWTQDELTNLRKLFDHDGVTYLCYQQEHAETTGTPHLQGYVSFHKRTTLSATKKLVSRRAALFVSKGSPQQNRDYCTKSKTSVPGTFEEYGTLPNPQGARNDFQAFQEAVENGLSCKRQARRDFPELVAKYPRWCYDVLADPKEISLDEHELYQWQSDLRQTLQTEPDDRKIIFVIDHEGNQGKTWFAKYYTKQHADAQFIEPSKKADMAYALQDDLRVLFLNVTRTSDTKNQEYLYSFVESVKDGMVFSPKYESRMKYYGKVHVVVMMNTNPNMELLSQDRYEIIELS